jgi:hypothetical protein
MHRLLNVTEQLRNVAGAGKGHYMTHQHDTTSQITAGTPEP